MIAIKPLPVIRITETTRVRHTYAGVGRHLCAVWRGFVLVATHVAHERGRAEQTWTVAS